MGLDAAFLVTLSLTFPSMCTSLDWVHTYNGYQYAVVEVPRRYKTQYSWYEGSDICMAEGGYLTSITSESESEFIQKLIKNANSDIEYWIGVNDLDRDGHWEWTDGKNLWYTDWSSSNPRRYEYCANMNRYGSWYSDNCGEYEGFICKRRSGDTTPKTTQPPPTVPGYCPGGWVDAGTNRCYKIFESSWERTWGEALDLCRALPYNRAELACANKQQEIDTLTRMTREHGGSDGFMFGLRRSDVSFPVYEGPRAWTWSDNSRMEATNFHRYIQEDDVGCGYMSNTLSPPGSWDVWLIGGCIRIYRTYICQIEKDPNNIIPTPEPTTPNPSTPGSGSLSVTFNNQQKFCLHITAVTTSFMVAFLL